MKSPATEALAGPSDAAPVAWRLNLGAEVLPEGVRFRVWAPRRSRVEAVIESESGEGASHLLVPEGYGYFSGLVPELAPGTWYRYRLDGGDKYPDPCSRFQPRGPHGPSEVVDTAFDWRCRSWQGLTMRGQVIYELHVGAFTPEGTYAAAAAQLPELRRLGVTAVQLMPLAEFPGRFNWGYDGVDLYAPEHEYGRPEDLRGFIDEAHVHGIGVILDVVYNHFGPDGNYLAQYSEDYVDSSRRTEWGDPVNFDGPGSREVREFVVRNACYWIAEYRFDGLRLDATHAIFDGSPAHILAEIARRSRQAAGSRPILIIAENEAQDARCTLPVELGGFGFDAAWNDDYHHSVRVALTGRREAYFTDYLGSAEELAACLKRGFLYQGQYYLWQKQRRGAPITTQPAQALVVCLQNHDQIGNSVTGERIDALSSAARLRAATALLLLGPQTPMLFMGQEFGAGAPFQYFAHHEAELAGHVREGRRSFLKQFPSFATPEAQARMADPADDETFRRCKLDFSQRESHAGVYALHQDLLRLRRENPLIACQDRHRLEAATVGSQVLLVRWPGRRGDDLLLCLNLGGEREFRPAPEPLLAPPAGARWRLAWSSEDPRYGGAGVVSPVDEEGRWRFGGESAVLLEAVR